MLLPETLEEEEDEKGEFSVTNDHQGPPKDDEEYRKPGREKSKSYAERLPKHRRTEKELPRVTAFCTAQAYKLQSTASFIRQRHGARAKLYDDGLYCAYHLPLLPGTDGYRILSSPPIVSAKGRTAIDDAIERSEQRNYRGDYDEEEEEHSVRGYQDQYQDNDTTNQDDQDDQYQDNIEQAIEETHIEPLAEENLDELEPPYINGVDNRASRRDSTGQASNRSVSPSGTPMDAYRYAEMFVFNYGVVVFWNFTERQEKDVLADLTFATSVDEKSIITGPVTLATNPLDEEDFETEEFHFEYNNELSRPRIYNDMITLRSGDHMIKLAISHAIAQSTKLSFFEETMAAQMEEARDVPVRLAKTGELGMKREDIIKLLGGLFKSRVEVNLSSDVLDTPALFWEDEPNLHPLYIALTEYLEIKPRIQVLNERCRVFLDLAEVLSDYTSDNKMTNITWIIIFLIVISICVTCSEVILRFGILVKKGKHHAPVPTGMTATGMIMPFATEL